MDGKYWEHKSAARHKICVNFFNWCLPKTAWINEWNRIELDINADWVMFHQRQAKYTKNKLKALRARNDYLLCVEAANAAVNKYFVEDLPDLIDVSLTFCYCI